MWCVTWRVGRICTVPPWECSQLNPNNSLVRSSRVSLPVNFELLVRFSGELSVDKAPAIGKVLACSKSSHIKVEENIIEDGGLEWDSPIGIHHKSVGFIGADEGLGVDCATATAGEASNTLPVKTDIVVGELDRFNCN